MIFGQMASCLKIVVLTCLLSLVIFLGEVKPVLAGKGKVKKRVTALEQDVKELSQKMKEQGEKLKEQEEKLKEQDERIKELEECDACSKIAELNETLNDLKEGEGGEGGQTGGTEPTPTAAECQNYGSLTNVERKVTYDTDQVGLCDNNLHGWYRFEGAAGTKMPTDCAPYGKCGTTGSGWMDGEHPAVADGVVTRTVYFHGPSGCHQWNIDIQVRNCGSFYVYKFNGVLWCNMGYCGTD